MSSLVSATTQWCEEGGVVHATFFTPLTKLNWTSRRLPSSIHRPTYPGYNPPQSLLVSACRLYISLSPLAFPSSPPLVINWSWFSCH
ncbi:hypothetical protein CHARACLAT_026899 [Characodon lateralis]|uniref:Uncharacterized protein n=1 Tax=Characodon lateralis TaxID=208331 RepID=A0ABU7EDD4_9TELE|nr:hypothetical protein [Characodon lateralis]